MILVKGERVAITCQGRTVKGIVVLASTNGDSLMLEFEALLMGYVGKMPVSRHSDGNFYDLVLGEQVQIEREPETRH